ncbi:hypothetical protein TUM4261_40630 [Shewanella sp. c952]|uniref:thioredoxin family protein n=1 Tax=Shewanella sp. c952 TaxID=2815913 RepID=UPI001BC7916D|nr:thioredoxin family protein [Shewanella sp. c952]GIU19068.1 hypothetical protein TUM4261_40630 [Shewanella sp. c952]
MPSLKLLKTAVIAIAASLFLSLSAHANSFEKIPFDKTTFDQLQAKDETFLVDIYATWCPTCKKQQQVLNDYFNAHPNSKIKVLVVDFDEQKEWVKYFKAPRQSSLYLYKGKEQVWFSVAETREQKIFSALNSVSM